MTCPSCGSRNISSNREDTHSLDHSTAHVVGHSAFKHPGTAMIAGGLWLAAKAINKLTPKWVCNACSHAFN